MKQIIVLLFVGVSGCLAQTSAFERVVYFDSGKSELKAKDIAYVDSLATELKQASGYEIVIKAFCDATGDENSNQELSQYRAIALAQVLAKNGIDKTKVKLFSMGESNPVADNETELGKAKNRRAVLSVEITKGIEVKQLSDSSKHDNPFTSNLSGSALQVGKTLILKNLNFEGGTPILLPESEPVLKELLQLLKDNPTLEIEIGGHVCCGPDLPLSQARAKRVWGYLVGYGINKNRMTYKGYSFDKPLNNERTEEEKSLNRRVEITILKM